MARNNPTQVVYLLRPVRFGLAPFTHLRLSGVDVRHVDKALHEAALANATKILRKRPDR